MPATEVDWCSLDRIDEWHPYRFGTGELHALPGGFTKPTRKRDHDGDVMLGRALQARGVAFCVQRLMTAEEAKTALNES